MRSRGPWCCFKDFSESFFFLLGHRFSNKAQVYQVYQVLSSADSSSLHDYFIETSTVSRKGFSVAIKSLQLGGTHFWMHFACFELKFSTRGLTRLFEYQKSVKTWAELELSEKFTDHERIKQITSYFNET